MEDTHPPLSGETSPLLDTSTHTSDADIESLLSSRTPKDEHTLHGSAWFVGERLPYNDYTTIDWLHDLVKESVRVRQLRYALPGGFRGRCALGWDAAQGWIAAFLIGVLTAVVAYLVDVSVRLFADWKEGHCDGSWSWAEPRQRCGGSRWQPWSESWEVAAVLYVGLALLYGTIAGSVTMKTKANLPAVEVVEDADGNPPRSASSSTDPFMEMPSGKMMYMAAGSGIPEIKTILSGFVIPHFLDFKVLVVKAVGAVFAVASGMCLGKEGPFVHISTCVGNLVARRLPKYRDNERKMREMLSVACSAGLSVAFGAPIGGVLFSYEEISTYFPRPVLWKAFLCSFVAAATLRQLDPEGTGRLVLFKTDYGYYGEDYAAVHYLIFVFLGICGGIFGGVFCKANFRWTKFFRQIPLIKHHPVFEVFLVVLATSLLQYPNRLIRSTGDIVMEELLSSCRTGSNQSWPCEQERLNDKSTYHAWLITGTLVKLLLTIITFGCKVPSGVIIPALDAGALFGRAVGQIPFPGVSVSPGAFAMVGSAAFLAGVSRMTVSLVVVMFELTGEVDFILPFMVAVLTAKWVADAISQEGVYDLSQHLLGHPFLDAEYGLAKVQQGDGGLVEQLIPPSSTMDDITVNLGTDGTVRREQLQMKLEKLKARGLMDAGLVLVNDQGICRGYLPQAELEFALSLTGTISGEPQQEGLYTEAATVNLLRRPVSDFVDRTPLTIPSKAPVEYAVEMFGKLGLRYLVIVEEDTAKVLGLVIKKRLVNYLDGLKSF